MENKQGGNPNLQIIRDPNLAKNRIFIGNLPVCTRDELESICFPYGQVLGSLVQKNFGFVQFESEEVANKAASALTRSTFKGNVITVRNAATKPAAAKRSANVDGNSVLIPGGSLDTRPDYNDCEIIVVDRKNTKYAEFIEDRLKRLKLRVDVLFPNEDVALGQVLTNISSRGCLYAVLVTNQHQDHNSITVNILYGQPAEHRNMPVEDAISLIANDFRQKCAFEMAQQVHLAPAPVAPQREFIPEPINGMVKLMHGGMALTVPQLEIFIKYLQEKRQQQLKAQKGPADKEPDPEILLQKKYLEIMNKPSVRETHYNILYKSLEELKTDAVFVDFLSDKRVASAIDTLMESNLPKNVSEMLNF